MARLGLLAIVFATVLLASSGCGGDDDLTFPGAEDTATPAPQATSTQTPQATTTPTPSPTP